MFDENPKAGFFGQAFQAEAPVRIGFCGLELAWSLAEGPEFPKVLVLLLVLGIQVVAVGERYSCAGDRTPALIHDAAAQLRGGREAQIHHQRLALVQRKVFARSPEIRRARPGHIISHAVPR